MLTARRFSWPDFMGADHRKCRIQICADSERRGKGKDLRNTAQPSSSLYRILQGDRTGRKLYEKGGGTWSADLQYRKTDFRFYGGDYPLDERAPGSVHFHSWSSR